MTYYFKLICVCLYYCIFLVLANLFAIYRPFHANNTHRIMKWLKPALWLANLRVNNLTPYFQYNKPAVYILNHQDLLDPLLFSQVWPKDTVILIKRSLLFFPLLGSAYWLSGNLFINRCSKKQAWNIIEQATDAIMHHDKSVAFMPEGTRSGNKGLLPFKLGAFVTAIRAGVDIIPICASPTSQLNLNSRKCQKATIQFLEPISTQGLTEADAATLAQKSHLLMKKAIEEMAKPQNN